MNNYSIIFTGENEVSLKFLLDNACFSMKIGTFFLNLSAENKRLTKQFYLNDNFPEISYQGKEEKMALKDHLAFFTKQTLLPDIFIRKNGIDNTTLFYEFNSNNNLEEKERWSKIGLQIDENHLLKAVDFESKNVIAELHLSSNDFNKAVQFADKLSNAILGKVEKSE